MKDLGMASNYVNCIMQDSRGLFYVGMYGALQTYDGQRFHDVKTYDSNGHIIPSYVTSLLERRNGDILVGTSAHGVMLMYANRQDARQMNGVLGDIKTVQRMMEDSRGNVWLVTESQGLLCYDGKKIERYFQLADELDMVRDVC